MTFSCFVISVGYFIITVNAEARHKADITPLILTPYLDRGEIEKAQKLSSTNIGNVKSYSGFFSVNRKCDKNLFFWFFTSEKNEKKAPVLLWLNGGPCVSSLVGLFGENGPFSYTKETGLVKRKYRWTKRFNIVYFDQPAGTGFSTTKKECYAQNLKDASQDMVSAVSQFFRLFPKLYKNKFFLTGESYAGHFIPRIAVEIDKQNRNAKVKINLVGLIIGNPWLDAKCIFAGNYLYGMGIIDKNGKNENKKVFKEFVNAINAKNFTRAYKLLDNAVQGGLPTERSDLPDRYNILYDIHPDNYRFKLFVRDYKIRKKLHVGLTEFKFINYICNNILFVNDGFLSVSSSIEYLLKTNKYIVGLYFGQLDIVCPYSSLPCVLDNLQWPGRDKYMNAPRSPWYVSDRLAGWFRMGGNLFDVVVRGSGHFTPKDQPQVMLELITSATAHKPRNEILNWIQNLP